TPIWALRRGVLSVLCEALITLHPGFLFFFKQKTAYEIISLELAGANAKRNGFVSRCLARFPSTSRHVSQAIVGSRLQAKIESLQWPPSSKRLPKIFVRCWCSEASATAIRTES